MIAIFYYYPTICQGTNNAECPIDGGMNEYIQEALEFFAELLHLFQVAFTGVG